MDIFTYIRRHHRRVGVLMNQILASDLPHTRLNLFNQLRTEVMEHTEVQNRTFYLAIKATAPSGSLQDRIAHAEHVGEDIESLLDVLGNAPVSSPFWAEKFDELKLAIEQRFAEAEDVIFPRARVLLTPGQCRSLVSEMQYIRAGLGDDAMRETLVTF